MLFLALLVLSVRHSRGEQWLTKPAGVQSTTAGRPVVDEQPQLFGWRRVGSQLTYQD
jgi:hypothetical protein